MPEYRWGIFLNDKVQDEKYTLVIIGEPVWQQVLEIIDLFYMFITQGDTEPAS